jgi:hypothetical protein
LRKPETLFEEVLLAVFLEAAGRSGEALQIVTFLGHHFEFTGDLAQWKPVAMGICLQARLLRIAKRAELAQNAMQRLASQPFLSEKSDEMLDTVLEAKKRLADAFEDKSTKSACRLLAQTLLTLCVYAEVSRYDRSLQETLDVQKIEALITDGMSKLKQRITA